MMKIVKEAMSKVMRNLTKNKPKSIASLIEK